MTCAEHADVYPRWEPPVGAVLLCVDAQSRLHYATPDGAGICDLITKPA